MAPSRFSTPAEGFEIMGRLSGWGEISRYIPGLTDDEHNYDVRSGLYVELLRWADSYDLAFQTDVELVANPDSIIGFNPRAFFWDESLSAGASLGGFVLDGGYTHRCKHDIENLDILYSEGEERSRVMIYDSVFLRGTTVPFRPFECFRTSSVVIACKVDYFTVIMDDRKWSLALSKSELDKGSAEELVSSAEADLIVTFFKAGHMALRGKSAVVQSILSGGLFEYDSLGELSADIDGKGGTLSFYLRYEHQYDICINPYPQEADLIMAGIRVQGLDFTVNSP